VSVPRTTLRGEFLRAERMLARAVEAERKLADAWDEGFTRGFYDVLAGTNRDASESSAVNPYRDSE
jgi:hypothetical protein